MLVAVPDTQERSRLRNSNCSNQVGPWIIDHRFDTVNGNINNFLYQIKGKHIDIMGPRDVRRDLLLGRILGVQTEREREQYQLI